MKDLNKKRLITSLGIFIFVFTFSIISLSEVQALEFKPQVGIPGSIFENTVSMEGNNSGTSLIAEFVKAIYNYGVSIGAILAAIMLMAGGLIWLTSGGSQEKVSQAKDIIFGSVIGLFILMGAYTILNMVNPNLVDLQTRKIDSIQKLSYGCCETKSSQVAMGETNIIRRAQMTTAEECQNINGAYKGENYIPNTDIWIGINNQEYNPGSVCIAGEIGCCMIVGSGITGNIWDLLRGKVVQNNFFTFPSSKKNCPGSQVGYAFGQVTVHFADEKCDYNNVTECTGLTNGTKCFDDHYINSSCDEQVACGFCYYDSCLITLGKEDELCGGVGSVGGRCRSSCHSIFEKEDKSGRHCENHLTCCVLDTQVQLGE